MVTEAVRRAEVPGRSVLVDGDSRGDGASMVCQ